MKHWIGGSRAILLESVQRASTGGNVYTYAPRNPSIKTKTRNVTESRTGSRDLFSSGVRKGRAKCVDEKRACPPLPSPPVSYRRGHLFSYLRTKPTPKRKIRSTRSSRIKDRGDGNARDFTFYALRCFSGVG